MTATPAPIIKVPAGAPIPVPTKIAPRTTRNAPTIFFNAFVLPALLATLLSQNTVFTYLIDDTYVSPLNIETSLVLLLKKIGFTFSL